MGFFVFLSHRFAKKLVSVLHTKLFSQNDFVDQHLTPPLIKQRIAKEVTDEKKIM